MTPEEGSAENSGEQSAGTSVRRPPGRGRYSRGRRRPRRTGNRPRPVAASAEAAPDVGAAEESQRSGQPLPPPFQPAKVESVQAAIEKVTAVIGDLRDALNDMELVLEYLEDVERQQIADEREIETLQQRLNSMHRRPERYQPPQRPSKAAKDTDEDGD